MIEPIGLTEALVGFARTLTGRYEISDVLHDLVERVSTVLDISGAGVSLRQRGTMQLVTADKEHLAELERVQQQHNQGPCISAMDSGEVVAVRCLPEEAERWPSYVARAAEVGVVAVAAVPMRDHARIGALDLYHSAEHSWRDTELDVARVFADIATGFVLYASELRRQQRTNQQLQQALDSRIVIEQAKGIIATERKISVDQAFAILRNYARERSATLRVVATAVVEQDLRP